MLSSDQIAANRKSLSNLLRGQMNLPAAASDWSYSQRVDYNKAFAAYVLAHPDSFGTAEAQTAAVVVQEQPSQLDDTSLSANVSAFGSALTDEVVKALDDVGGIGRGVLTAASLAAWVIPGSLLILGGIYLWGEYQKKKKGVA